MIVGIHQPEYLPWIWFFDKVAQSDLFVLLDNVQFEKNYIQNRTKIKTQSGWIWLTVPVLMKGRSEQLIKDVEIVRTENWQKKHWRSIFHAYKEAPYFQNYRDFFEEIYSKEWKHLADLNETIIRYLIQQFGIEAEVMRASQLGVTGKRTDLLLAICKALNATTYLSGVSGKDYLEESKFAEAGIEVRYQEFRQHPVYPQLHGEFIPQMSVVDLLFNCGPSSMEIIRGR